MQFGDMDVAYLGAYRL